MLEAQVMDLESTQVGTVSLDPSVFGVQVNKFLLHEVVVMQRACQRQGSAATKTRGMVRGGGRKPWRQKHTGRARHGSIRSPLWRGGGVVFGPAPRTYAYVITRKKYRISMRHALSAKHHDGALIVVRTLPLPAPQTKHLAGYLKRLGLNGQALIVVAARRDALRQAARNLPMVEVMTPRDLNVYDVLRFRTLVVEEAALRGIMETWRDDAGSVQHLDQAPAH